MLSRTSWRWWSSSSRRRIQIVSSYTDVLQLLTVPLSTAAASPAGGEGVSHGGPPPIRVALTESAGRAVFATRRIGIGELIHTAKPIVSHPSLSNISTVCNFCLKRLKPIDVSQAQDTRFCSGQCMAQSKAFYEVEKKVDWSTYHNYCRSQSLKYPLLVKRLACMVIAGAVSADCLDILQPEYLSPESISRVEAEYGLLRNALDAAHFTNEDLKFLTKQWYSGMLARVRINAFRIELLGVSAENLVSSAAALLDAEAAVGNAVYILPSFYNHDCDPNAHILWIDNVDAKLKALCNIEEGEELRICYIDASMDRYARQSLLLNGFGFKCSCDRCESGD
ncbi:hypothetical protein Dimus_012728 [Dionaea muscipula]